MAATRDWVRLCSLWCRSQQRRVGRGPPTSKIGLRLFRPFVRLFCPMQKSINFSLQKTYLACMFCFSHFRPRDATRGNSFFQMSSYARANGRITNEKNKRQIPMRASRGLKGENKIYMLEGYCRHNSTHRRGNNTEHAVFFPTPFMWSVFPW